MPVFNEEEAISQVVRAWFAILDQTVSNFTLLAINDGSTDDTEARLEELRLDLGERVEIHSRPNRGHGQSCIEGYRIALDRNIPFILQIDSDGQSDPQYFPRFWDQRAQFAVIYGKRDRHDGIRRIIASNVLRVLLLLLAKADCVDANVPYRLMDAAPCATAIRGIPGDIFLANIALAVVLKKDSSIRHGCIPIGFPPRAGGEPSVPFSKFAAKGLELFRQLHQSGISRPR